MVITNTPTIAYCSKPHRNPLSILIIIFIFLFSHCSSLLLINLPSELAETIFCFSLYSYEAGPVFFFSDLLRIHCYISCRTLLFWLATVPVKGHWRLRFGQNHGRNARKKLTAWNWYWFLLIKADTNKWLKHPWFNLLRLYPNKRYQQQQLRVGLFRTLRVFGVWAFGLFRLPSPEGHPPKVLPRKPRERERQRQRVSSSHFLVKPVYKLCLHCFVDFFFDQPLQEKALQRSETETLGQMGRRN